MAYTTIDDPSVYFQSHTFTKSAGTGSTTFTGNSDLQPDFLWTKSRTNADSHELWDSSRGVNSTLFSDNSGAEDTSANRITSFNTDGYSWGNAGNHNAAGDIAAWAWKVNGGTTVSQTTAPINSTAQKNSDAGINIIQYTGNGANSNFEHGFSVQPDMVIVKQLGNAANWCVWHKDMTTAYYMRLDQTMTQQSGTWDGLNPSATRMYVYSGALVNGSGLNYICYAFKSVQGYSKFGKYTGNGSTDGTFVYTGFKPAFVMTKNLGVADSWVIMDSARSPSNVANDLLVANEANAENTSFDCFDFVSNGFKNRRATSQNVSGNNYIYMAFAENPFVTSTGVPTTAR